MNKALRTNAVAKNKGVNSFHTPGHLMEMTVQVVNRYVAETPGAVKMHLNKAVIGMWKEILKKEQEELCRDLYGEHIRKMGYEN